MPPPSSFNGYNIPYKYNNCYNFRIIEVFLPSLWYYVDNL